MKLYPRLSHPADFTDLPPLTETPGYRVLRGDPRTSIRFDQGDNNSDSRMGLWKCTEGSFECVEKGDELQTLISGKLTLIRENGEQVSLLPGDSVFTFQGEKLIWDIQEEVTKVFFTQVT